VNACCWIGFGVAERQTLHLENRLFAKAGLLRGGIEVAGGAVRCGRVRLLRVIVDNCRVRARNDVFCLKMFKERLGPRFPF
jgi:hypothetical protein